MSKDPVCGNEVDERDAKAHGLTAEFGGQVRFFCSKECREMFVKDPTHHWQAQQAASYRTHHHGHGPQAT